MIFYHTHVPVLVNGDRLKAPRFLANEVNAILDRGEDVYLLVYSAKGKEMLECKTLINLEVRYFIISEHYSVPKRLFNGLLKLIKIWRLIYTYKDAIVLVKGPTPLLLILYPIKYTHRIYLYLVGDYTQNISSLKFGKLKNLGIKFLAYSVDYFIKTRYSEAFLLANSQILLEKYSKYFKKFKLVRTSTISQKDIVLKRNYSTEKFVVLFVGRVDFSKGVDELIKAFKKCYEAGIVSKLEVIGPIIQNGLDVKTKVELDFANDEFMDHVNFVGPVFDEDILKNSFLKADVFVLPSKSEGFPRVFWEAFSFGLPVITTRVGDIPFVLTHNVDAILLERGDADEIYECIAQLFSNRQLFINLNSSSKKLAYENTIDGQVDGMLSFFYEK